MFAGDFVCDEQQAADDNLLRMLEYQLYDMGSKEISFDEFQMYLKRISEVSLLLKKFGDKEDAIKYLVDQTGLSEQECSMAYDFYMKLFK